MNLSNKAKYGLRIMMYIATASETMITVQKIFSIEDVSKRYLEQIFSDLKKHGLVKSVKGKHGGYYIDENLNEITVYDVIKAFEGKVDIGVLPTEGQPAMELVFDKHLWEPLQKGVEDFLSSITVAQLLEEYQQTQDYMFYI